MMASSQKIQTVERMSESTRDCQRRKRKRLHHRRRQPRAVADDQSAGLGHKSAFVLLVMSFTFYSLSPLSALMTGGATGSTRRPTRGSTHLPFARFSSSRRRALQTRRQQPFRRTTVLDESKIDRETNESMDQRVPKSKRPNKKSKSKGIRNNSTTDAGGRRRSPSAPRKSTSPFLNQHRQLNQKITKCETAVELLQVLQSETSSQAFTKQAGGGVLNSVNFSTAMHRLARHSLQQTPQQQSQQQANRKRSQAPAQRATILTDPRFALFLAGLAEALAQDIADETTSSTMFRSRELSNIVWAIAKLKIAPPLKTLSLLDGDYHESLLSKAKDVREQVLQAVQEQKRSKLSAAETAATWIPDLSQLSGFILDAVSHVVHTECERNNEDHQSLKHSVNQPRSRGPFQMQEYANLLWGWATAGRLETIVALSVSSSLINRQRILLQESSTSSNALPEQGRLSKSNGVGGVLRPQEWSNSVWSFATSQIRNPELLSFIAELVERYEGFVQAFKSQELSNCAWGVATLISAQKDSVTEVETDAALKILRKIAHEMRERADTFRTQELSNSIWALATLGFGLDEQSVPDNNQYVVLRSSQKEEDSMLAFEAVDAIVSASLATLPRFRSQELNNLAWSLARLVTPATVSSNVGIRNLLEGIATQIAYPRRQVTGQDIGTVLWSLATLEFVDEELYRDVVMRFTPDKVRIAKPQEISNAVYAIASTEIPVQELDAFDTSLFPEAVLRGLSVQDPFTIMFGLAAAELMRRPFQFKPQEIKDVLWSFSKAGIRHPRLFKAMAEHLVGGPDGDSSGARGFDGFSPQGLGNTAYSFARQAQLAVDAKDRVPGRPYLSISNGRLAVYTAIYFDIGEHLVQKLFKSMADYAVATHDGLRNYKPQDLSNSAWTFAVLGLHHSDFMQSAISELKRRVKSYVTGERNTFTFFKGQEAANLIWALATLNVPVRDLLDDLAPYLELVCSDKNGDLTSESIGKIFNRQELANVAWSCAVFGRYPHAIMQMLYIGLIGDGTHRDPSELSASLGDSGLQPQAVMSLIYVQTEMDLAGTSQGLVLPPDFPDGWQQSSSRQDDNFAETTIELSLSTSNIQRAVSSAFSRIDFNHVDEYVITMEQLSEQRISLPAKPLEILSIDIADPVAKIAVEVDGPAHFLSDIDEVSDTCGFPRSVNGRFEYNFVWNGDDQRINGPTALKQRLLTLLGWKVIHLPFWEWYALGGDEEAENHYCRELLSVHK